MRCLFVFSIFVFPLAQAQTVLRSDFDPNDPTPKQSLSETLVAKDIESKFLQNPLVRAFVSASESHYNLSCERRGQASASEQDDAGSSLIFNVRLQCKKNVNHEMASINIRGTVRAQGARVQKILPTDFKILGVASRTLLPTITK